jgi:hypothetical protein
MILSLIFLHLVATEECDGAPFLFVQTVLPEFLGGCDLLEFAVRATTAPPLLVLLLFTRELQEVGEDLIKIDAATIHELADGIRCFRCRWEDADDSWDLLDLELFHHVL